MKKAGSLLGTILDLGEQLLISGAEVWRVEEILGELFEAYCFKESEIAVTSAFIEATVQTWDDRVYTQIRGISGRAYDLDKLQRLFSLIYRICETPTGIDTVQEELRKVTEQPGITNRQKYMATMIGAMGFCALYGGGLTDLLVATFNAIVVTYLNINISKHMKNALASTIVSAFIMEIIALAALAGGITDQLAPVTIAGIFLLISGIGLANGIGELMHSNTLSGLIETAASGLGALGIAIGISMALLPFRSVLDNSKLMQTATTVSEPLVIVISCTIGCMGFAMLMGAKGKALLYSVIGSALTQTAYQIVDHQLGASSFIATLQGACFVAVYAILIHHITKIPGLVFRIACILPLVPGSKLYYTVLGAIRPDFEMFKDFGSQMLLIAAGIALGYITVDVAERLFKVIQIKITGRI